MSHIHVIGAGVAGLAAALELSANGKAVTLYEATDHAGGRCRSFHDESLGEMIDNGSHLLLGANASALRYVKMIGSDHCFHHEKNQGFPFVDLTDGTQWILAPRLWPGWLWQVRQYHPQAKIRDFLRNVMQLALSADHRKVTEALNPASAWYRLLWEPLTLAALNTHPQDASARLLWQTLRKGLVCRGGMRPWIAKTPLAEALIDPVTKKLASNGVNIRYGKRLKLLEYEEERVTSLHFKDGVVSVENGDMMVLAVPPWQVAELLGESVAVPYEFRPIMNVHYRATAPSTAAPVTGILGGRAQWIICRGNLISVTISDAGSLAAESHETIARTIWEDVRRSGISEPEQSLPPHRVICEKRATFAATPQQLACRPDGKTPWHNLFLAGDYVDTGLPATLDGAIQSGFRAARCAMKNM